MVCEDVDGLVLCLGHASDATLARALHDWPGAVHYIGDCVAPRTAEEAVLEGLNVGATL